MKRQPIEIGCDEFLNSHTEYLDGTLTGGMMVAFDAHVDACAACGKHDRVLRRGLLLVRNSRQIQPSADFHERLNARLATVDSAVGPDPAFRYPMQASPASAVMIASILGFLAITPVAYLLIERNRDNGAPVDAALLENSVIVAPSFTSRLPVGLVADREFGDYSPVLIQAPVIETAPMAPRMITYPAQSLNYE